MTQPEPVWDGEGVDPWLPHRLAQASGVAIGERTVYDDYFARLSRWLVETDRRMRTGPVVDPNVIWSMLPRWVDSVAEFVHDTLRDIVGQAYRTLLGSGYSFDQRPHVVSYLTQAQNRLVDVPNQVYDLVVGQVAEGAGMGESMPKIRDRVQQVFNTTATPHWQNRATVVARTETLGARNAGRSDAFRAVAEELEDDQFEHMWLGTVDTRIRPEHREADGQRQPLGMPYMVGGFPMMRPGDPTAPAHLVIQCRCTELLLRPGEDVDLSNRQFLDY